MPMPIDLVRQLTRLDPMPTSVLHLMKVLQDEEVGAAEISGCVEHDPAMVSVVLRLANSAAYGRSTTPVTIRSAVLNLCTAKLLDLVLGDAIQRLKAKVPMYGLGEDELWLHSAAASLAVKALRQEMPSAGVPESAAIAALLHDIGKLVMGRFLHADVREILATCRQQRLTFVQGERELLQCDHTEVGGALSRHWGLAQEITEAIERHHQDPIVSPTPTTDAVVVGNLIAKCVGAGLGAEGLNLSADSASQKRLGLTVRTFSRVCLQTLDWLNQLKTSYGVAA